jgi:hypothetical protein
MIIAQQIDTRPPFWWIGLFASPGGLMIVGAVVLIVLIAIVLIRRR